MRRRKPLTRKAGGARNSSKLPAKRLMERADRLAREFAKRSGVCLVEVARFMGADIPFSAVSTPCAGRLEWAHLKSRGPAYYSIRHDPENSVCLCSAHHRLFHAEPDAFVRFIDAVHPGRWDSLGGKLRARARSSPKKPLAEIYADWIEWYGRMKDREPLDEAALAAKRMTQGAPWETADRLSALRARMPGEAARSSYFTATRDSCALTVLGEGWELELSHSADGGFSVSERRSGAVRSEALRSWDEASERFLSVVVERFGGDGSLGGVR